MLNRLSGRHIQHAIRDSSSQEARVQRNQTRVNRSHLGRSIPQLGFHGDLSYPANSYGTLESCTITWRGETIATDVER